jgi:DNA-binding NtrC family response regulator
MATVVEQLRAIADQLEQQQGFSNHVPMSYPRVLLVEKEAFLLECLKDALTSWNLAPDCAETYKEGLRLIRQFDYDIIISSRLLLQDAVHLLKIAKAINPLTHCIVTTGDPSFKLKDDQDIEIMYKPMDLKTFKKIFFPESRGQDQLKNSSLEEKITENYNIISGAREREWDCKEENFNIQLWVLERLRILGC